MSYFFTKLPFGSQAFIQWLSRGETPLYPHPEGKRRGIVREADGEVLVYAGRFHSIWTPPRWVRGVSSTL